MEATGDAQVFLKRRWIARRSGKISGLGDPVTG